MATTTNKQRLLVQLLATGKKGQEPREMEPLPVLEQFIYGICREGATRDLADRAFCYLHEHFFDWNEVRVSSLRELEEAFHGLSEPERRAERLIMFLQEVFETTFSFDLESLHKKGLKQAAKQLSRYQAANDYIVSWVVQHTLGGHAVPLDTPTLRTARRLGLVDDSHEDLETVRASLEHLVPKARGSAFGELISRLANQYCHDDEPDCAACPLVSECVFGQQASQETVAAGRSGRLKPR
jgi:endonuclease-3